MKKKILLATANTSFPGKLVRYAIDLAQIMDYDVTAIFAKPERGGSVLSRLRGGFSSFASRAGRSADAAKAKFAASGVGFEYVLADGDLGSAIENYHHETKRVEFVLTGDEPPAGVTVPVHRFESGLAALVGNSALPGIFREINLRRIAMSSSTMSKRSHLGKAAIALAASGGIYAALFANESLVTSTFTKGGLYAALPIATAFAFSFVYGAFAHSFWTALGIEAHHKTKVVETRKAPAARKDTRPRPTLSA